MNEFKSKSTLAANDEAAQRYMRLRVRQLNADFDLAVIDAKALDIKLSVMIADAEEIVNECMQLGMKHKADTLEQTIARILSAESLILKAKEMLEIPI